MYDSGCNWNIICWENERWIKLDEYKNSIQSGEVYK
jgi:hypothetical protein